ncbi:unnamed protein product [Paramecium sonneborni]|uniref:Uncharacterized protein n=1 Tax=Paramecium sonneborni TaxID=65129 RepID=A0A8S1RMU5_9CILI|nr:unnamed protein product [Paramecium sonneborni]
MHSMSIKTQMTLIDLKYKSKLNERIERGLINHLKNQILQTKERMLVLGDQTSITISEDLAKVLLRHFQAGFREKVITILQYQLHMIDTNEKILSIVRLKALINIFLDIKRISEMRKYIISFEGQNRLEQCPFFKAFQQPKVNQKKIKTEQIITIIRASFICMEIASPIKKESKDFTVVQITFTLFERIVYLKSRNQKNYIIQ